MRDIARETGLSVTAVSLVLGNKPNKISEASKKRILETAERLNFHPNLLAVGLVKKHTNTLGLILPDIGNAFYSQLALGVDAEAYANGRSILLVNSNMDAKRDLESLDMLAARGVDAIILCVSNGIEPGHAKTIEEKIKALPIPVVLADRHEPSLYCSSVSVNNAKGGELATEHLLSLGHRRILFVTGQMAHSNNQERLKGCVSALERHGLGLCADDVVEAESNYDSGGKAAGRLARGVYTAAFLFNDMMAYGFCGELYKLGVRIPEDISVVGFDNIFFSELMQAPLTTVAQPVCEIGRAAAGVALEEMDSLTKTKRIISFEPELIVRKSTGPRNTDTHK